MKPSPFLVLVLASIACGERSDGVACMPAEGLDACPAPDEVDLDSLSDPWDCDQEIVEMRSTQTPEITPSAFQDLSAGCCYDVIEVDRTPNSECAVGRPFVPCDAPVLPVGDLPADPVAAAWVRLARAELASVAAFARLQLELLAAGAPIDLVQGTAAAMADEVAHATALHDVAAAIAGAPIPLGAMPIDAVHPRALAALAEAAVVEGCLGETLSAALVREAAERATDPALAATLGRIADDEERHAALSWAIVAWAWRSGDADVRAAIRRGFAAPAPFGPMAQFDADGLIGPDAAFAVADRALAEVVRPAAAALLAA